MQIQRVRAVAVLTNKEGKVLILKRIPADTSIGHIPAIWEFPAGGVEFGESPEQAIEREVWEETKIKAKNKGLLTVVSHTFKTIGNSRKENDCHEIAIAYHFETDETGDRVDISQKEHEHSEYKWIDFSELENIPQLSFTLLRLIPALKKKFRF